MITKVIKFLISKGKMKNFNAYVEEAKEVFLQAKGCEFVDFFSGKHNEHTYFCYSMWEFEDDYNAFRESAEYLKVWNTLLSYTAKDPQQWTINNTADTTFFSINKN